MLFLIGKTFDEKPMDLDESYLAWYKITKDSEGASWRFARQMRQI